MSDDLAVALVDGAPVTEFPKDLHIPPEALKVFIELFEGPLDLLLYLVRRQNIDVLGNNILDLISVNVAAIARYSPAKSISSASIRLI